MPDHPQLRLIGQSELGILERPVSEVDQL